MFKFCWHKWGKWSRVIQDYEGSLHQMCECEKCGVIKRKRSASWMMGSLNADQVNDAIEDAHGITSDMKQEHVDKTAKQRHEENT